MAGFRIISNGLLEAGSFWPQVMNPRGMKEGVYPGCDLPRPCTKEETTLGSNEPEPPIGPAVSLSVCPGLLSPICVIQIHRFVSLLILVSLTSFQNAGLICPPVLWPTSQPLHPSSGSARTNPTHLRGSSSSPLFQEAVPQRPPSPPPSSQH